MSFGPTNYEEPHASQCPLQLYFHVLCVHRMCTRVHVDPSHHTPWLATSLLIYNSQVAHEILDGFLMRFLSCTPQKYVASDSHPWKCD